MTQELKPVNLSELHFDPENPRLPQRLRHAEEPRVLEYLLLECNLIELMLSIAEQGYFAGEPLLVVPRATGGFEVVEGNRRLGALKLLQQVDPPVLPTQVHQVRASAKHKPTDDIPVIIFQSRDEILSYLGYRHITGIKEWNAIAKARYLYQLRQRFNGDHHEAHKALAKEIGSKSSYVAKLLTGLKLVEAARDGGILSSIKMEEDDIPFSLLTTAIGYESICDFIGLSGSSDVEAGSLKFGEFNELFHWIFDRSHGQTRLGDSRNLDKLSRIVNEPRALEVFRRGGPIDEADLFTSGPIDTLRALLREVEQRMASAQSTLSIAEGIDDADISQAERIRKASVVLHSSLVGLASKGE